MAEIKYEVKEIIGKSSEKGPELRLVSWNDRDPKYDLRTWYTDKEGNEKCNKGITLTKDELKTLGKLIAKVK